MRSEKLLYKVTVRFNMGAGIYSIGVYKTRTFYILDVGDATFSKRMVDRLQHGNGAFNKDFFIDSVECLGTLLELNEK